MVAWSKYTAQTGRAHSKVTQQNDREIHIITAGIITEYNRK